MTRARVKKKVQFLSIIQFRLDKLQLSVIAISMLAVAGCGVGTAAKAEDIALTRRAETAAASSPTASTEPTIAATSTPIPPTLTPSTTPSPTPKPLRREEFDGDLRNWNTIWFGERSGFDVSTLDGKLLFDISDKDTYVYLVNLEYTYDDVKVIVRARNLASNNNNVSIICRQSDKGWYEFNIANNGLYWIYRYDDFEGGGFELIYNGGSQSINTGKDVNEYTGICVGPNLTLLINGVEERTVVDTVLIEGQVGVSVSSFDFVPVQVEIEWMDILAP